MEKLGVGGGSTKMRWLVTAVAVGLLCCASPGARASDEPRITMQLNDISVSDALRKVFAQAKIRCVIDGEVTGKVQALSLSDVPLKTAVRTLARYANADFEVKDGAYFVKPKAADPPKVVNQPAPVGPPPMLPTAAPERPVAKQQPPEPERANTIKFVERKTAPASAARRAAVSGPAVPTTHRAVGPTYSNQSGRAAYYARARMMRSASAANRKYLRSIRQITRTNAALKYYYKHKVK